MAQSKIELLLELKDKFSRGLTKAKSKLKGGMKGMTNQLDKFKTKHVEAFSAMRSQFPLLDQAVTLLGNPYALAAAGAAALGTAIYKLGAHLFDVSKQIKTQQDEIRTYFKVSDTELKTLTNSTMAIQKVFGTGQEELLKAGQALQKEFASTGMTATQSMGLIKQAMLATNGKLDLEQITEYSSQLKELGLKGSESMAFLSQAFKDGTFNDKGVDALKEAKLSLLEMDTAQVDALKGVGLNPDQIKKDLNSGKKTVFDTIREISGAMKGSDLQSQQKLIADIFKGAGEDVGKRFLLSLQGMNLNMDALINKQDPLVKKQMEQLRLNERMTKAQAKFAPIFNKISTWWDRVVLKAKVFFYETIGAGIAFFTNKWTKMAFKLVSFLHPVGRAFWMWKKVLTLVWSALQGVGKLLVWLGKKMWEVFTALKDRLMKIDLVRGLVDGAREKLGMLQLMIKDFMKGLELMWNATNNGLKGNFAEARSEAKQSAKLFNDLFNKDYGKALRADRLKNSRDKLRDQMAKERDKRRKTEQEQRLSTNQTASGSQPVSPSAPVSQVVGDARQSRSISVNIETMMKVENNVKGMTQAMEETIDSFRNKLAQVLLEEIRDVERAL